MPFVSQAQRGFMFAKHPEIAKRWAKETPPGKLPQHVSRARGIAGRARKRMKADGYAT